MNADDLSLLKSREAGTFQDKQLHQLVAFKSKIALSVEKMLPSQISLGQH